MSESDKILGKTHLMCVDLMWSCAMKFKIYSIAVAMAFGLATLSAQAAQGEITFKGAIVAKAALAQHYVPLRFQA